MPSNVVKSIASFLTVSLLSTVAVSSDPYQSQCQDDTLAAILPQDITVEPLAARLQHAGSGSLALHNQIAEHYSQELPWRFTSRHFSSRVEHYAQSSAEIIAQSRQVNTSSYSAHIAEYHRHQSDQLISTASEDKVFFQTLAVSDQILDESRGAFAAEQLGVAILETTAINNVTQGGITGDNSITDNAFSGTNGIVTLIQNSGNNVSIQQATIINLSLE